MCHSGQTHRFRRCLVAASGAFKFIPGQIPEKAIKKIYLLYFIHTCIKALIHQIRHDVTRHTTRHDKTENRNFSIFICRVGGRCAMLCRTCTIPIMYSLCNLSCLYFLLCRTVSCRIWCIKALRCLLSTTQGNQFGSVNQSINQPISQPINQPISQPCQQSVHPGRTSASELSQHVPQSTSFHYFQNHVYNESFEVINWFPTRFEVNVTTPMYIFDTEWGIAGSVHAR